MANRLLTINIRKYLVTQPVSRRRNKAVRYIRDRIGHYTKTSVDNVKMSQELNQMIFKHYWRKMTPVKVNVSIENGIANASPFQAAKKEEPKAVPQKAAAAPAPAAKKVEKKAAAPKAEPKPAAQPKEKK
jgi:ribosomal protein L31E